MWQLLPGRLTRAHIGGGGVLLSIAGTPVTSATVGVAYAGFTVAAAGGIPPYSYSVASGSLPSGITLNSSSGAVSGTPSTAGSYSGIVIRATDAASATADLAAFTITVGAPPAVRALAASSSWLPSTVITDDGSGKTQII